MKILITGVTGFFGKALVNLFIKLNKDKPFDNPIQIVGLSRNPPLFYLKNPEYSRLNWLKIIKADVKSRDSFFQLSENFTHLIHLAVDSTNALNLNGLERFDYARVFYLV